MRTIAAIVVLFLMFASPAIADTRVGGYVRKNGTVVTPHVRSSRDGTRLDNFSTRGNVNPYTQKGGSRSPNPMPRIRR